MPRYSAHLPGALAACVSLTLAAAARGQDLPAPQPPPPPVRIVQIAGTHEIEEAAVRDAARITIGEPLPVPPDRLNELSDRIESHYHEAGYTFATAKATFAEDSGTLTISIDEGVIGGVEFTGVEERLARMFADEFALRAGDVFNRRRAREALDVMLRQTRGAIRPGRINKSGATFYDSRQLNTAARREQRGTFDLVDRNGQRVLLVGLYEAAGRFKIVPDLGDREDWFTSVDGFVPSLGFGAAVFDHDEFNHAYVAGHLSYKMAADRAGYAIGFERPLLRTHKIYVGAELHDLTASDDLWQVSPLEASLAAVGPRRSFRDYYRRRGVQIGGAFRAHPRVELLFGWRRERQESLAVQSDFSFWHSDEPFRPNRFVRDGRLSALVLGASIDGTGFDQESLEATYRRHQLETPFGERLHAPDGRHEESPIWRIDWTSELSAPGALGSDFDFRRHVVSARYRRSLSPHQDFGARAIGGWSQGVLPPQRLFGIGGIGSVHGYEFKESIGDSMALMNLEYELGWRRAFTVLGFFDAGRVGIRTDPRSLALRPETPWLTGVGWGIGISDFRIEFGYKLDAVPSSLQVLLRFGRTF